MSEQEATSGGMGDPFPFRLESGSIRLVPESVRAAYAGQVRGNDVAAIHIRDARVGELVLPLSMAAAYALAGGLPEVVADQDALRERWRVAVAVAAGGGGDE